VFCKIGKTKLNVIITCFTGFERNVITAAGERMHSVIFCNGILSISRKNINSIISQASLIIAADGGADHLAKLNIRPNLIIGDMDSIVTRAFDHVAEKIVFNSDKAQTDTELAVLEALKRKSTQITLLAATGGRLDHTLANIALLKAYPGKIVLIDHQTRLIIINQKQKLVLTGQKGSLVSLFSVYDANSSTIKTSGLTYNLNNQKLIFPTRGTSNALEEDSACIMIKEGLLQVCSSMKIKFEVEFL
jgi:thiamine pyrophosphokinase